MQFVKNNNLKASRLNLITNWKHHPHNRPDRSYPEPRRVAASVRWRHWNVRKLSTCCRRRFLVEKLESHWVRQRRSQLDAVRLQLNVDKNEILWCTTSRRRHQMPTTDLLIGGHTVIPKSNGCDLGIYIDADLVMRSHVQRTVSPCFSVLRRLRQIRRWVPRATFQSLVVALVPTRLEYGNGVLVGLPAYLMRRLQSVLNAAARLIFDLRHSDRITDAMASLPWLRASERVQCKIAVLAYKALHGNAPGYVGPVVRGADFPARRNLRLASTNRLVVSAFKLSTVGSWTFSAAASQIWNTLPEELTSAESPRNVNSFGVHILTYLFDFLR